MLNLKSLALFTVHFLIFSFSINFLEWKEESFRLKERHSFGNIALILLFIF